MLSKRLIIVSGKGGVGKSAVAAGIAMLAQRRGLRVLAVEMGPDGGLASHFGTGALQFDSREVRPGLHAMRIVRSEALLEYLSLQLRIPGVGRFGPVARAFDALATTAPAVREIITLGKVLWEVKEDRWDLVVADAPPTGQLGSYLRAPVSIAELVPTGRIGSQAEWMRSTLADSETTLIALVTLPEELPAMETAETLEWLKQADVVPEPMVIANRVLPTLADTTTPKGVVGEMARLHRDLRAEQERWLGHVHPDLTLPFLFGLFTPGEVAANLSEHLERVS